MRDSDVAAVRTAVRISSHRTRGGQPNCAHRRSSSAIYRTDLPNRTGTGPTYPAFSEFLKAVRLRPQAAAACGRVSRIGRMVATRIRGSLSWRIVRARAAIALIRTSLLQTAGLLKGFGTHLSGKTGQTQGSKHSILGLPTTSRAEPSRARAPSRRRPHRSPVDYRC